MARKTKLERIATPANSAFTSLSREQLLLHSNQRAAADELYRRAYNKMVKKQQEA